MKIASLGILLVAGSSLAQPQSQAPDPNLAREVRAVRVEAARSMVALRQYAWTERTEVLVDGKAKSSNDLLCRYDAEGKVIKEPMGGTGQAERANTSSNRPVVRKKADNQDYIQRAITIIHNYMPPKPEQFDYLVQNGYASLGRPAGGTSELRVTHYFQSTDVVVFTYDTATKTMLKASVAANLGTPKDPVTMDIVFEKLPDRTNHVATATLNAKAKKVQVITRNMNYQKLTN